MRGEAVAQSVRMDSFSGRRAAAASLQACQTTLVWMGSFAVCHRLPGNSHTLGLRRSLR